MKRIGIINWKYVAQDMWMHVYMQEKAKLIKKQSSFVNLFITRKKKKEKSNFYLLN